MFPNLLPSFFTLLVLHICVFNVSAQSWSTGSGGNPQRNCQTEACGPAEEVLLWQGGFNSVIAQQAVISDGIVVTSRIFNLGQTQPGTFLVAQDLSSGQYLWTKTLPVDFESSDWRSRVSAIRGGKVYATRSGNTNKSFMYALDAMTGDSLWQSEALIDESSTESANFADNGDLIIGNNRSIVRINHEDGSTIWELSRSTPTSNGQEVAIYDGKGYYWEPTPGGPEISVVDLETGTYLYSSGALSPGLIQQLAPFIGPDGIIYAPRSMNNPQTDSLYALEDTGNELITRWTYPIGFVPFSTSGVGPDGTIYTYNRNGKVVRLYSDYGDPLDSSQVILTGSSSSPRMAIDAAGLVYVTNGEFDEGALYVFNPDLSLKWSTAINRVNIGGPAIGQNGTMIVCGVGMDVRAYKGAKPSSTRNTVFSEIQIYPNPVRDHCHLRVSDETTRNGVLRLYNQNQQEVLSRETDGQNEFRLDLSSLPAGPYIARYSEGIEVISTGLLIKQ